MNNKKCPYCGFINFVHAEVCHKCETSLNSLEETYVEPTGYRPDYSGQRYALAPQKTTMPIFKILGVLVLIGVASVIGLGILGLTLKGSVKWEKVTPAGSDLAFWMPGSTTTYNDTTPTAIGTMTRKTTTAVVPNQGEASFTIVDFSTDVSLEDSQIETVLNGELDNLITGTKSQLISKNFVTVQGLKALEFQMIPQSSSPTSTARGYGKLILNDTRLYCLVLVANADSNLFQQKDKFLNPERNFAVPARLKIPKFELPKPIQPYQPR